MLREGRPAGAGSTLSETSIVSLTAAFA
jgi:hypothetical protein